MKILYHVLMEGAGLAFEFSNELTTDQRVKMANDTGINTGVIVGLIVGVC
ncbi:MAG: hypothetical protein ACRC6X_08910 [Culicoidibacterales bacterium]